MLASATPGIIAGRIGYAMALVAFASLCLYFRPATVDRQSLEWRIWLACAVSAVWAALCWWHALADSLTATALYWIDAVQMAAWLWVLSAMARLQQQPRWLQVILAISPPLVLAIGSGAIVLAVNHDSDAVASAWFALLALALPLLGILAVEQVYRNSAGSSRQNYRWFFLGVGGAFLLHLFQYAEAVAVGEFSIFVWGIRGLAFPVTAVLLYKGVRTSAVDWRIGLFVSRQVVFFTTSLVMVGVYLILMSAVSIMLEQRAGPNALVVQSVFLLIAGAILFTLIFSAAIRRRLMAFLATHFFRNRYDYRIEWLRFVKTLTERASQGNLHENAIRAVCQIVGSDSGALWLLSENNQRFEPKAQWPQPMGSVAPLGLSVSDPLLDFMARTGWVADLKERAFSPELYDNAPVPQDFRLLGDDAVVVPMLHIDSLYGLMLLRRPPGRDKLHFEDRDLLKTVCRHLAAHLWQVAIDQRLTNSRQFEAYNRMTAFVMHDLKNLTAQLQLIVSNAAKHKRNPEFVDDAMVTIANSVDRMSKLLAQLSQGASTGASRAVSLADVVQRTALRAGTRLPVPAVAIEKDAQVMVDPEQFSMVLDHVLRNAQDATPANGSVDIRVAVENGVPQVDIRDNGSGMDETFVNERLFKPFDTTKGARGMGIGAYQAREYMRSVGGDVRVNSRPGSGTIFSLVFGASASDVNHG